jgi:hypothetical protein
MDMSNGDLNYLNTREKGGDVIRAGGGWYTLRDGGEACTRKRKREKEQKEKKEEVSVCHVWGTWDEGFRFQGWT